MLVRRIQSKQTVGIRTSQHPKQQRCSEGGLRPESLLLPPVNLLLNVLIVAAVASFVAATEKLIVLLLFWCHQDCSKFNCPIDILALFPVLESQEIVLQRNRMCHCQSSGTQIVSASLI